MTVAASAGPVAAVFVVDVLDHLLAPLVLESTSMSGGSLRGGDEALEQQVGARRVDGGDAQAVAHGGVGRRAAALTEDVPRPGEADDVVDGEEVGRVAKLRDQRQLVVYRRLDLGRNALGIARRAAPSAVGGPVPAAGAAFGGDLVGVLVAQLVQREGAAAAISTVRATAWDGGGTGGPFPPAPSGAARHWGPAGSLP